MELVVVNGASAISRGLIRSLTKSGAYSKVRLLDFRPYRRGVYSLQSELGQSVLDKRQVQTGAALDVAFEGAQEVLFLTHDYTAMTSDKNSFLETTARLSKKHGVSKLVSVAPIEHDLYWSEDAQNPWQKKAESQANALSTFKDQVVLNTNLVYGDDTYLLHFMTQCVLAGSVPAKLASGAFKYRPVSQDDLGKAVEKAFGDFDQVKGQSYSLGGEQEYTLQQILNAIESAAGKGSGSTSAKGSILGMGLSDFVEEFFVGIAHDKNMGKMADFFDKNSHLAGSLKENDFFAKVGLSNSGSLEDFYREKKLSEEAFVFPTFTDYKLVQID